VSNPDTPHSIRGHPSAAQRLDARDLRILEIIQKSGRISTKGLARAVGLSLTPCFQRVHRLERAGYIRGYRGMIDARHFGNLIWVRMEVTLARHRAEDFELFEETIRRVEEVLECDAVGGGIDYLLRIIARDVAHFQRIIEDLLNRDIGIDRYSTYIVTKQVKESAAMPLGVLVDQAAVMKACDCRGRDEH
jgi:Lrp/AsnC family transcriptional regulator, regulator of ectoine-degradation genes